MLHLSRLTLVAVPLLLSSAPLHAQRQADVDAINRLIDQYGATEDAMDMPTQARLMSSDRVWVGPGTGRRTDQATNMRIQQAFFDGFKKQFPGAQTFTEDRDRLIRFHANGTVAIASFYRYTTVLLPPTATPEQVRAATLPPGVITLVLEKQDGAWKIVHTHVSNLQPAN